MCAWRDSRIALIRFAQNRNIGKTNNVIDCGSKETKGSKQDSPNR